MLIFDKSFLQSLSVDESCWLQNFFLTNITPLFYVETLADIEKQTKANQRPPIAIVKELASKSPEMGSVPNMHHMRLIIGNMLGQEVEMTHKRPVIQGGQYKAAPDGTIEIHFEQFPESAALERWQRGDFLEIEKKVAKDWRDMLSQLNFDSMIAAVTNIKASKKFSNLEEIKLFLDEFIKSKDRNILLLAFEVLGLPNKHHKIILDRWDKEKPTSFEKFCSYAAFVLKIDLLFYLAMERGFISKERPSHKIDLSYLYYLPFCMIFVSNDKLHAQLIPLFIDKNQIFVQGSKLKEGLRILNDYYNKFEEEIKKVGIIKFASQPPKEVENEVTKIWDFFFPKWRETKPTQPKSRESEKAFVNAMKQKNEKSVPISVSSSFSSDNARGMLFKSRVRVQKGKWRIMPEGIEDKKGGVNKT